MACKGMNFLPGGYLPQPECCILAAGGQSLAIGRKRDRDDSIVMPLEATKFFPFRHVPQTNHPIGASHGEGPAVRREGKGAEAVVLDGPEAELLPLKKFLPRGYVPEPEGALQASRAQDLAVGREGNGQVEIVRPLLVLDLAQDPPRAHVPESDRAAMAPRGQNLAIGAEGYIDRMETVRLKPAQFLPCCQVPEKNGRAVAPRGQGLAVCGQGEHPAAVI